METRDRNLELERQSKAARAAEEDEADDEDGFFGYVPEDSIQPPRAPTWNDKLLRELGAFPEAIQRATYSLIGQLAAGDKHAFQGVKRLKLNRNILRQRIGHSHRLLFRIDHEKLTILSVIDRRDLEKTIQSLVKGKELKD